MSNIRTDTSIAEKIAAVRSARTEDFRELIKISGLDIRRELRFTDWSGISFRGADLRDCDFTGARLIGCDFTECLIAGACFDQAEIDTVRPYSTLNEYRTNISGAQDWVDYVKGWRPAAKLADDSHLPIGSVFKDAPFAPELVVVPAGCYMMGASPEELLQMEKLGRISFGESNAEFPQHLVTLSRSFAVSRFVVTASEWGHYISSRSMLGGTHIPRKKLRAHMKEFEISPDLRNRIRHLQSEDIPHGKHPCVGISWLDAQKYVTWLREITGCQYRLLSESEWEYCCRSGTSTAYNTGNTIAISQANFTERDRDIAVSAVDVGTFSANAWGLFDMHGNVSEWCRDVWHDNYEGAPADGLPWVGKENSERVFRGGAWANFREGIRSAKRYKEDVSFGAKHLGFRVARDMGALSAP